MNQKGSLIVLIPILGILFVGVVLFAYILFKHYGYSSQEALPSSERTPVQNKEATGKIAYLKDGDLFIVSPQGGNDVKITTLDKTKIGGTVNGFNTGGVMSYSFSPDGQNLAFTRMSQEAVDAIKNNTEISEKDINLELIIANLQSMEIKKIGSNKIKSNPVWLDREYLATSNDEYGPGDDSISITTMMIDGTNAKKIFQSGGLSEERIATANGKIFIGIDKWQYGGTKPEFAIQSIDAKTQESNTVVSMESKGNIITRFDMSQSGKLVYISYFSGENRDTSEQIYTANQVGTSKIVANNQTTQKQNRVVPAKGLSWSPNEKFFAYFYPSTAEAQSHIIIRDETGKITKNINSSSMGSSKAITSISWSPDSTSLVISSDNGLWIVSKDSTSVRQLKNYGENATWSK